jgi:hypothetical protein
VVAGKDVIPRLCYAAVRRLLRRLNAAAPSQPVMKAISMALGGRDKNKTSDDAAGASARLFGEEPIEDERALSSSAEDVFGAKKPPSRASAPDAARVAEPEPEPEPESRARVRESRCQGEWDDVAGERGLELRDHYASDFLVQPGFVIHLRHLTSDEGPTAEARHPTAFTEIPISTRMMADHVPMVYQSAIEAVAARAELEARAAAAGEKAFAEEVRRYGPGGLRAYVRGREALDLARETREARRRRRRRRRRRDEAEMRSALARAEAEASSFAEGRRDFVDSGRETRASTSPGERLWANVRRVVGVSEPSESGAAEPSSEDVSDEASDVSDDVSDDASSGGASPDTPDERDPRPIRDGESLEKQNADEDAWSEDDEADLLAAVAEMLGLDVSDPMPEERAGPTVSGTRAESPTHRRQHSWGLGRLGRLVGKLKRDADAMFAGAEATESVPTDNEEASAFEVDGYVAQARATNEGHER